MHTTFPSARAVAPGEIIALEIEERGWLQRDLAQIMQRPPQAISEIIRGVKQITTETAIELAEVFGTSPELWLNLEAVYRLQLARQRTDDTRGIATRSQLYSVLPIPDMLRRGWIQGGNASDDLESSVEEFFGGSLTEKVAAVSFRQRAEGVSEHGAQVAWVQRVRQLGERQHVPAFDRARLREAIPQIRQLMQHTEQISAVPSLLNNLGIRFVVVPQLPRTYIDGVLYNPGDAPLIGMTLRFDRIDSFWFTLMHEIAHLALNHQTLHLDNLYAEDDVRDAQETEANALARSWIIQPTALHSWAAHTRPYFARQAIAAFAAQHHVHPALVLGQLMFEKYVGYKHLRVLLEKASPQLNPWMDMVGTAAS